MPPVKPSQEQRDAAIIPLGVRWHGTTPPQPQRPREPDAIFTWPEVRKRIVQMLRDCLGEGVGTNFLSAMEKEDCGPVQARDILAHLEHHLADLCASQTRETARAWGDCAGDCVGFLNRHIRNAERLKELQR